jgi:nicotinamidase-related amidase
MADDRVTTALLVLDYQELIVDNWATHGKQLIERVQSAIGAARGAGMPVIYGVIEFRPGYPEVPERNQMLSGVRTGGALISGQPGTGLHPALQPDPDEPVVVRRRTNPFLDTDLDMILRTKGVKTVVIGGIATSGVVLSAVRGGGDLDYSLVVLSDCCDDPDDSLHRILLETLFPRQAAVLTSAEWIDSI